jgi:hypothetical protein
MRRQVFYSILAAGAVSLLLAGTLALATTSTFVLGSTTANKPDALTSVTAKNIDSRGGLNGKMIRLTNQSTDGSATALGLNVGAGRPPLTTNSPAKVANLNADKLDGTDATGFVAGGGRFLTARVRVVPSLSYQPIFDRSTGSPAYRIDYECVDPNSGGAVRLVNTSATAAADLFATNGPTTRTAAVAGTGGNVYFDTSPSGTAVEFDAGWYDGHRLTAWVFSYHTENDACHVQLKALAR